MRVHNPRANPADREPVQPVQPSAQTTVFPAPIGGKVTNVNMATQPINTAQILRNYWPNNKTIEPRGGARLIGEVDAPIVKLMPHTEGRSDWLFAATENKVFSVNVDNDTITEAFSGQTSGDYSTGVVVTDDLTFLMILNGVDSAKVFNGTDWSTVDQTSSPYAITGVDTADLSHVWNYRNRQFFIKKDSMDAYYLDINNAFGMATRLPLAGVFKLGGNLVSGATWSTDSGEGIDDRCVFFTDKGEFAIYEGNNPDSASAWKLIGVFEIGVPLGKNMHFQVGGDLIVATKSGLIPLTAAAQKERDQLSLSAFTYAIEDDWFKAVAGAGNVSGWAMTNWRSRNMLLAAAPKTAGINQDVMVCNTQTKAWSDFTGWDATAFCVHKDSLFFGNGSNQVLQGDTTGRDIEEPFLCQAEVAFSDLGSASAFKQCSLVRAWFKHRSEFKVSLSAATDYRSIFPTPPEGVTASEFASLWDQAIWDVSTWGSNSSEQRVTAAWNALFAGGVSIAPQLQILSDNDNKLEVELINIDVIYETGAVVV